jgi:hypothetical protein
LELAQRAVQAAVGASTRLHLEALGKTALREDAASSCHRVQTFDTNGVLLRGAS